MTMRADHPLRCRVALLLALLLVAGQTQAVVHALQHATDLVDPAAGHLHAAPVHDLSPDQSHGHSHSHSHGHSHNHPHNHQDLGALSCDLCAAGHVTLASAPPGTPLRPAPPRWSDTSTPAAPASASPSPLCRDPPSVA